MSAPYTSHTEIMAILGHYLAVCVHIDELLSSLWFQPEQQGQGNIGTLAKAIAKYATHAGKDHTYHNTKHTIKPGNEYHYG